MLQRLHDEGPLLHEGVGDGESRLVDGQVIVEEYVNIDGPVVVDGSTIVLCSVNLCLAHLAFYALCGT